MLLVRGLTYTTASELAGVFRDRGIRPKRRLGQNFLIDRNLLAIVADTAAIEPGDTVLEIGAGTGSLTEVLAARARRVIAVEIDPDLATIARKSLAPLEHVRVITADILGKGKSLNPAVLEAIEAAGAQPLRVVGDLPYGVSTPLITALITSELPIECMALTIQREVAERLLATPGTKAYGYLSVLVQLTAAVEMVRRLPPHVFWPPPKVSSAIIRIRRTAPPDEVRRVEALVHSVASALFQQRRKSAANGLLNAGLVRDRDQAQAALHAAGVPPGAKGDALAPDEIKRLAEALS